MTDTICFFLPKKYPTLELAHIKKIKSTFPSLKDEDILTIENEVVFWNDPQFPIWTGCIICGEKKNTHTVILHTRIRMRVMKNDSKKNIQTELSLNKIPAFLKNKTTNQVVFNLVFYQGFFSDLPLLSLLLSIKNVNYR